MARNTRKPRPVGRPVTRDEVANLAQFKSDATVASTGLSVYIVKALVDDGLIRQTGKVDTGKRGRPAHTFKLTSKGAKRVKRAEAKVAA